MRHALGLALVFAVLLGYGVLKVHAHADMIIQLRGNKLVGLPARYSPAEFDTKSLRLTIGKRSKELSPWLKGLFQLPHNLEFSASWYRKICDTLFLSLHITISKKQKYSRYR